MTLVHCERCGTTLQASAHPHVRGCPRCLAEGEYPVLPLTEGPPAEGAHPDLDVVLRAFRLLERGDRERMLELFAEDFSGRMISTGEVVEGPGGAPEFMRRANAGQNELEATAFRFERNGHGQVAVFGRLRMRGPDGMVDSPAAWIYSVADGRITEAQSYTSMARAQRALRTFAAHGGEPADPAETTPVSGEVYDRQ
jgi:ketosteroid isomerase-like protein